MTGSVGAGTERIVTLTNSARIGASAARDRALRIATTLVDAEEVPSRS